MSQQNDQITILLQRLRSGDRNAESELMPIVYQHLHAIAEKQFRSERKGHTLQPTALLSELYLRMIRDPSVEWQNRAHFYAIAAETIRRILVDHARVVNANKRPNPAQRIQVDDVIIYSDDRAYEVLMIDEALEKLRDWDARQARVVELRFFAGLSVEETAAVLGVSERTVKSDWKMARAWLSSTLNNTDQPEK
jgi:RNA polymerase sigma factor (TIGR02999 family)